LLALAACTTPSPIVTATITSPPQITPYLSPSPTAWLASTTPHPTQAAIPSATPLPSPTPILYTVKLGDTLGDVALRYGLTLAELAAANPAINPDLLTMGMTITIPLAGPEVTATVIPTPAPLAVELAAPVCYASADGGLWCLVVVRNTLPVGVENLSAWISLQTPGANPGAAAYAPLNLLLPGDAMPLVHFFPGPVPATFTPHAELLTALPAVITTTRYLTATVQVDALAIADQSAQVVGRVFFDAAAPPVRLVTLAAVAYAADDQPVGVVKWELAGDPLPASGIPFDLTVYSLGPAIKQVIVLAEANP
jgi:LysM repeat protein